MDEKHGWYDKFWTASCFQIQDINHRVIGFGGRVMGDGKPKYLNSPETEIFDKSRNLYGLNFARTSRKGNVILCEGYMDVIAMHRRALPRRLRHWELRLHRGRRVCFGVTQMKPAVL